MQVNINYLIRVCLAAAAFAVVNVALTLWILDRNGLLRSPEIVSVDAADMVMGFVAAQDPDVSQEALQARIRNLNAGLDGAIASFAEKHGVIVVNSAAVLGGTRDVTPKMLAALGLKQ